MQVSKRAPYMQTNAFYWWNVDAGVHMLVINVFPSRVVECGKKKAGMQIQLVYTYIRILIIVSYVQ